MKKVTENRNHMLYKINKDFVNKEEFYNKLSELSVNEKEYLQFLDYLDRNKRCMVFELKNGKRVGSTPDMFYAAKNLVFETVEQFGEKAKETFGFLYLFDAAVVRSKNKKETEFVKEFFEGVK